MRTSTEGREAIQQFEGLRLRAYLDSAGVPTVGYGHTRGVVMGQTITAEQAEAFLRDDLMSAEGDVERLITVPLTPMQHAALVSFTFNLGGGALAKSTLRKKLNAGDYDAVPAELMKWNKARVNGKLVVVKGLTNRRAAEAGMWARGSFVAGRDVAADTGERASPAQSRTVQASGIQIATGAGAAITGVAALDGTAQVVAIVGGLLIVGLAVYIMRERVKAWAEGWR